jgi:signal transduction histidine kinase
MLLHEFIRDHHDEIVERARIRLASRRVPVASDMELASGAPLFLAQLLAVLRDQQGELSSPLVSTSDERATEVLGQSADRRGDDMLRAGLSIAQVVEGYGDVCQAITDEAIEHKANITADEYRTLNLCLDVATARAVTAFSRERDRATERTGTERLAMLAHELRNLLSTATLSFEALRRGAVGIQGSTGAVLGRSLQGLRHLVDRTVSEVRLAAALHDPQPILLSQFIEDVEVGAALDAKARGLELSVPRVEDGLTVTADRQLLASALANLLQNALKFTRAGGRVSLTAARVGSHVHIAVEDECGGLAGELDEGASPALDRPAQDRTGLGLGLKISRDAVRADGGEIQIRNLPGKGCVFTIDLPAATS